MNARLQRFAQRTAAAAILAVWAQPGFAQQDTTALQDTTAVQDTTGLRVYVDTALAQDTTRIQEEHPQDSPDERGFLIVTANGKSSLRIRGSLRVNGAYDFRGLQSVDVFNTFLIPVGEANTADPRFFMSANQTRFGFEVLSDSRLGEVFLRLETDFRSQGNTLRLRHAYGTIWRILAGQTWSVFGDVAALPLTVDLDGPNSGVAVRTVQARYTVESGESWRFAVSAESPEPQIARIDSALVEQAFQVTPDIAGRARKYGDWGHTQIAGIFRTINVQDATSELQVLPGFGALLSGQIKPWERSQVLWQLVGGKAISRFISALDGQGLDVVLNPNTGRFETLGAFGGYISFAWAWRPNLISYFTAGAINVEDKDFAPNDSFKSSQYGSANVFWNATAGSRLGIEFSLGRRENKDGQDGRAARFSFIMYFDF